MKEDGMVWPYCTYSAFDLSVHDIIGRDIAYQHCASPSDPEEQ
jgi:hypothetical protein